MRNTARRNNFESHQILKFFFDQKRKHQPSYSLRALSRHLGISQSYVSEIFSGKKIPSTPKLTQLMKTLGMDAIARRNYEESLFHDRFPVSDDKKWKEKKWNPVSSGEGSVLKKWHYIVILDLAECKGFRKDAAWVARRLGIQATEANEALNWLLANKFLLENNGQLTRSSKKVCFSTNRPLAEFRAYHKQMLKLALLELTQKTDKASFERRLISGISFSCNPQKLEAAKKKLLEAIYSVADDLMDGECTDVYQLNLQLFPHSTPLRD